MDHLTQTLVEIIVLHKRQGLQIAFDNWNSCLDPDGFLPGTIRYKEAIFITSHTIQTHLLVLSDLIDKTDYDTFVAECSEQLISYQEVIERRIELNHRPSGIFLNKNAIINLSDVDIPEDILFRLSFGYKFLSPFSCNNKNMHSILAQLDQCMDEAIPDLRILEASTDIYRILSTRSQVQYDDNKKWLAFVTHRTKSFFKTNPHMFATKSDKGGHTVVMLIADYESKLNTHIMDGNYGLVEGNPLSRLIDEEKNIVKDLADNEEFQTFLQESDFKLRPYEPNTLQLPQFYGLPKIHKDGIPLRPITSTIGAPGYFLAKLFDYMLNLVFGRSEYHIRDTYEFAKFIKDVQSDDLLIPYDEVSLAPQNIDDFVFGDIVLKSDDVLCSFDVVSMFTSIPFKLVFDIIMGKADAFQQIMGISSECLKRLVSFLLRDCMVFTALDKIYEQRDGIPMGSCLSPTVARLTMDEVIKHLLERVPEITFIRVFVDDTIVALPKNLVDRALVILNDFCPGQIRFTVELENSSASINFLNVTLTRLDTRISTNWFRKGFASGRLLNFFSAHKRTTALATAIHFIKTVLILSDPCHFHGNKTIVEETLRINCFPETTIISLMNEYYTLLKPFYSAKKKVEKEESVPCDTSETNAISSSQDKSGYKVFPHSICESKQIKKVIYDLKAPRAILADSVRNTKINVISTRKTTIPIEKRGNLLLFSRCNCKRKHKIFQTKFNETGEMARTRILTIGKQKCDKHGHAYSKVKFIHGLFYGSQTSYLLRYVAWKYRHALDFACQITHPNSKLGRLIKCSCCRNPSR